MYCSPLCASRRWRRNNRELHNRRVREAGRRKFGWTPRSDAAKTCEFCGKDFVPMERRHKYCSVQCGQKGSYHAKPDHYRQKSKKYRSRHPEYYKKYDKDRHQRLRPQITEKMRERERAKRKRYPWLPSFVGAKSRAKKDGLAFNLTKEWCIENWDGACLLTGIPFVTTKGRVGPNMFSPSLDKIIPRLGYTIGNCRFICWGLNLLKSDGTDADMYRLAETLVKMRPTTRASRKDSASYQGELLLNGDGRTR